MTGVVMAARASRGVATTWIPTPDIAQLIDQLDLHDVVLVGHCAGGGDITRYIGRHGTSRVAKAVLVDAIPPLMLKTDANPDGVPIEVFDEIRASVLSDRSQFYEDLSLPFYGGNREGSTLSQGVRDAFWLMSMQAGLKGPSATSRLSPRRTSARICSGSTYRR